MIRLHRDALAIVREFDQIDQVEIEHRGRGHSRLCFTAGGKSGYVVLSCSPKNEGEALNMVRQAIRRKLKEMGK